MPFRSSRAAQSILINSSNLTELSDDELMDVAQYQPEAFDVLYRRYINRVYAYLYSFTHNTSDAEDLTSQTFFSVWSSLRRYRKKGTFTAWLFRIARNKANDLHRQTRSVLSLDAAENIHNEWDPVAKLDNKETIQRTARLIQNLDQDQIEMLRLHFSVGFSYSEIGAIIGRSGEATKMALHRLYQKLRLEWKVSDE